MSYKKGTQVSALFLQKRITGTLEGFEGEFAFIKVQRDTSEGSFETVKKVKLSTVTEENPDYWSSTQEFLVNLA